MSETRTGQLATPESFIGAHLYWVFYDHSEDRFFFSPAKTNNIRDYDTPKQHAAKLPSCSYITTFSVDDPTDAFGGFDNIVSWHRNLMNRVREKE